jgi:hypothetical protein
MVLIVSFGAVTALTLRALLSSRFGVSLHFDQADVLCADESGRMLAGFADDSLSGGYLFEQTPPSMKRAAPC